MTARSVWGAAILVVAGLAGATPAHGQAIRDFVKSVGEDTARRNCWPTPFLYPARQAAREPFATMVANGWERQNQLADQHFDAETGRLTAAGQAKVLWILNDAPYQHRTIFVHRAATTQETASHINTVEQFVTQSVAPCEYPPVLESRRSADGYPADRYDFVARKFQAAMPDPKLAPADTSGGLGGSTSH